MTQTNDILQLLRSIFSNIDQDLEHYSPLRKLEQYKIKPSMIFFPLILVSVLLAAIIPDLGHYISIIFGLLYPSYVTFQAIDKQNKSDCKKWQIYWMIFVFLTVFDKYLQCILFFIPAFYSLKTLLLIWLYYPRTQGIQKIHDNFIVPYGNKIKSVVKFVISLAKQK